MINNPLRPWKFPLLSLLKLAALLRPMKRPLRLVKIPTPIPLISQERRATRLNPPGPTFREALHRRFAHVLDRLVRDAGRYFKQQVQRLLARGGEGPFEQELIVGEDGCEVLMVSAHNYHGQLRHAVGVADGSVDVEAGVDERGVV